MVMLCGSSRNTSSQVLFDDPDIGCKDDRHVFQPFLNNKTETRQFASLTRLKKSEWSGETTFTFMQIEETCVAGQTIHHRPNQTCKPHFQYRNV